MPRPVVSGCGLPCDSTLSDTAIMGRRGLVGTSLSTSTVYTDVEFLHDVYVALLGRSPDEVGKNTYLDGLSNGQISRQDILRQVMASEEYSNHYRSTSAGLEEPLGCSRDEAEAVFGQFAKYEGPGRAGYVTNFMGGVSEVAVSHLLDGASGVVEGYPIPGNFHGETLEWIGTLRAALASGDTFTMIELGAGWGPWCVIGAMAAKQKGVPHVRVIGIEADAGHVDFMRRNFTANGLAPSEAEVLHGAIGLENGTAYFPQARSADQVYGGAAAFSDDDKESGPFAAFMRGNSDLVETVEVPCFALSDQLNKFDVVDLVHCDIQGAEFDLIPQSVGPLTAKVKRLIVGTHSFEIDRKLSEVMGAWGWVCEGVSACKMRGSPGGPRLVADGMQVWRNPKQTRAGASDLTRE